MWMSLRHKVPIDPARFQMNGKALCLMSLQMFAFRVPIGGKLLYKDFQLRLTSAFHRELYETKSQHSLHFTPLVLHIKPVIKAKVSSHNHLHFIFDLESEKAEGSNSTLLEYTYFNRIKHRKKYFIQENTFRYLFKYYVNKEVGRVGSENGNFC